MTTEKQSPGFNPAGIAIGIPLGTAIGVSMDNLALGLGLGTSMGVALAFALGAGNAKKDAAESSEAKPDPEDGDKSA